MKRYGVLLPLVFLAGCGGGAEMERPKISRAGDPVAQGMTYTQFRQRYADDDFSIVQKRFVMLDRDNNGVLAQNEYSGN